MKDCQLFGRRVLTGRSPDLHEETMKSYLFLDIDGVLNHSRSPTSRKLFEIDPEPVVQLNRIVESTRPEIVISSTWRINHDTAAMAAKLVEKGFWFPELVVGATASIYGGSVPSIPLPESRMRRGVEIIHWLETHAQLPYGMVILDDETSMWVIGDRLVKTNMSTGGLKARHVEPAIQMLQTPLTELPDSAVARLVHDPFVDHEGGPQAIKENDE